MKLVTFADLETTGKLHPDHRIIEASFRVCNLETQEELENHLFRFNPERNIDAAAERVHGISLSDLKKEPKFIEKIDEVRDILVKSHLVVFHNGISFDWPYLKNEFSVNKQTLPEVELFDTMVKGTFATDLGKSPTLQELCFSLDVDYAPESAHRGDYDTAVLRDCFFNGIRFGWFKI